MQQARFPSVFAFCLFYLLQKQIALLHSRGSSPITLEKLKTICRGKSAEQLSTGE